MSLNISKQGVINISGGANPNLLVGSNIYLKQTTDGWSNVEYTIPDLSQLKANVVFVVSVDIELYNVASMNRIGCEPSFGMSNGNTYYAGIWTTDTTNRKERIYTVRSLPSDATSVGQRAVYIQNVVFNTGGYIIISNPKLEISSVPTPWIPNVNDSIYVGKSSLFETDKPTTTDSNFVLGKNYLVANNLYEI